MEDWRIEPFHGNSKYIIVHTACRRRDGYNLNKVYGGLRGVPQDDRWLRCWDCEAAPPKELLVAIKLLRMGE